MEWMNGWIDDIILLSLILSPYICNNRLTASMNVVCSLVCVNILCNLVTMIYTQQQYNTPLLSRPRHQNAVRCPSTLWFLAFILVPGE